MTAQLSGRMRRFRIRVIPGDRVQVGLSPYDPSHGFITFRLRDGEGPQTVTESPGGVRRRRRARLWRIAGCARDRGKRAARASRASVGCIPGFEWPDRFAVLRRRALSAWRRAAAADRRERGDRVPARRA